MSEPMRFEHGQMVGTVFNDLNLANSSFTNVNLSGTRLEDVNLSGVTIENANVKGLKIFGYDVGAWLKEQLEKDGCHLD